MRRLSRSLVHGWLALGPRFLPFADVATAELPLGRLLRLSLFQMSVGMAVVLVNGTLNRVMIVELGVPAALVAFMLALPLVFAPFRALLGFRSDHHRSAFGWRRVPYIWFGSLMQFGGLAIMPFALLVLSGDTHGPLIFGHIGAALAFLLVGAGLHTTQTAGLALATDLAPEQARPRVVAFLYVMLLAGMILSALVFSALLETFSQLRLIQVIQGAAVLTMVLNMVALWKQEPRRAPTPAPVGPRPRFRDGWRQFRAAGRSARVLVVVGLGTAAFSMQDILLEPFGGEIFAMGVAGTTALTAFLASGTVLGLALAARLLAKAFDPYRLAAMGAVAGLAAFSALIFAAPLAAADLLRVGAVLVGFGGGLFAVGTMTAAMELAASGPSVGHGQSSLSQSGLALGCWGAVQASAAGIAIAAGGALRDTVGSLAASGALGDALAGEATGYLVVYHIELALLFATLIAIGPLVGRRAAPHQGRTPGFGLTEIPA